MPRLPLLAAGALVLASLVLTALVRITGTSAAVELPASSTAVRELALFFDDTADGRVLVRDARTERVVGTILPGEGGFVRATMRGLVRERRRRGLGPEAPFLLSARSDGRVVLTDPATGRLLDLGAYGPDNARAFVRFLDDPSGGA
jgi:putative photosynthetic complex assembly protein